MADVKKLNDRLSVATQLTIADLRELLSKGFKTIINNRPDDEVPGQPKSDILAEEAERLGLAYFSHPVTGANISEADVDYFDNIVEHENGPILAFCRTGTRCATLWALSEADNATTESILETTHKAGYNLKALKPRLDQRRAAVTKDKPKTAES